MKAPRLESIVSLRYGKMSSTPLGSKRSKDVVVLQAGRIFHTKRQHGYYEGQLTKRGGSLINSWKLRHFRLRGTTLSYFENDRSEHSKGEIHFHNMTVLRRLPSDSMPFMFSVSGWRNGSPRTLELSAKSEAERDFWLETLDASLHEGYAKFDYPEYWFKPFYPRADMSMWLAPKVQLDTGGMVRPADGRTPPSITHCCGEGDCPAFALFVCDFAFPTFDKMDSKVGSGECGVCSCVEGVCVCVCVRGGCVCGGCVCGGCGGCGGVCAFEGRVCLSVSRVHLGTQLIPTSIQYPPPQVFLHWALVNIPNHAHSRGRERAGTRVQHLGSPGHGHGHGAGAGAGGAGGSGGVGGAGAGAGDDVPHPLPEFAPQMWTKNSLNNEGTEVLPFFPPAPPFQTGVHRWGYWGYWGYWG